MEPWKPNPLVDDIRWADSVSVHESGDRVSAGVTASNGFTVRVAMTAFASSIVALCTTPFAVLHGGVLFYEAGGSVADESGLGLWFTGLTLAPIAAIVVFFGVSAWMSTAPSTSAEAERHASRNRESALTGW